MPFLKWLVNYPLDLSYRSLCVACPDLSSHEIDTSIIT